MCPNTIKIFFFLFHTINGYLQIDVFLFNSYCTTVGQTINKIFHEVVAVVFFWLVVVELILHCQIT
jgi:hypothetical protein